MNHEFKDKKPLCDEMVVFPMGSSRGVPFEEKNVVEDNFETESLEDDGFFDKENFTFPGWYQILASLVIGFLVVLLFLTLTAN